MATSRPCAWTWEASARTTRDPFVEGGQRQGTIRKRRFATNAIGMSFLENHLPATVDCTGIRPALREQLFMPSRNRLREGSSFARAVAAVEKVLADSPPLAGAAERRRDVEISKGVKNDARPGQDGARTSCSFSRPPRPRAERRPGFPPAQMAEPQDGSRV